MKTHLLQFYCFECHRFCDFSAAILLVYYCGTYSHILNVWNIYSQCCEGVVAVISTHSMALKAIVVWKRHQALPVPTNVFFVGGRLDTLLF